MSSRRPRLLITGFGPFPGMPRNPSADLACRIAASPRWRRLTTRVKHLVLPTTYAALDDHLGPALEAFAPDAVLMIGVAGRANRVRIEARALNRLNRLLPDAEGRHPERASLPNGAMTRRSRADPDRSHAILRRHGIPCVLSQDAGRYLCNAAYYRALGGPIPVLFIHIPNIASTKRRRAGGTRKQRLFKRDRLAPALVDVAVHLLALTLQRRRSVLPVAGTGRAD